jgi:hypothetical protein
MSVATEFQPTVAVCTPMRTIPGENGGTRLEPITVEWHRAMKMLLNPMGYNVGEIRIDGYEIGDARNMAVKESIKRGFKYLMFVDADTLLPQNGMQLLTYQLDNNPDYDIAAGIYTQKGNPAVPLIWNKWGEGVFWDWTLGDVLKDGIVGCGTGCMMIRMSLFDRLPEPWFVTEKGEKKSDVHDFQYVMSDDLFFCRRAVEDAQAKILIDTKCYCTHIDWHTGKQYSMADDALPVKRLAEKMETAA